MPKQVLYVPDWGESEDDDRPVPGIVVAVTHEDVYQKPASWEDLGALLGSFSSCAILLAVSKLNSFLFVEQRMSAEVQRGLAAELFSPPERDRVLRLLESPDCVAISDEQLLGLAKQAVLMGSADGSLAVAHEFSEVLKAALMVSELLTNEHANGDSNEDFLPLVVRGLSFNRSEPMVNLLARYCDLLIYRPYEQQNRASPNWIDLRATFKFAFGIDPLEFVSAGLAVLAHFSQFRRGNLQNTPGAAGYVLGLETLRSELVDPNLLEPFLVLTARDEANLMEAFQEMPATPQLAGVANLPFLQTPLMRCVPAGVFPVSLSLLVDALTVGLYWRLHAYYRDKGDAELHRFTAFLGELFQDQVFECLERQFPSSSGLVRRLFGEMEYGKPRRRGADATLVYDDAVVFVEVSSSRMKYLETVVGAAIEAIDADIEKCIVGKATQLDRVVKDFQQGVLALEGVGRDPPPRIYPVIVLLESFPLYIFTWQRILTKLAERNLLAGTEPLRVISSEELERIEPLLEAGHTFKEILEGWAASPQYYHQSLKNYLLAKYPNGPFRSKRIDEMYQRLRDELPKYIKS